MGQILSDRLLEMQLMTSAEAHGTAKNQIGRSQAGIVSRTNSCGCSAKTYTAVFVTIRGRGTLTKSAEAKDGFLTPITTAFC
jgi:hypothetical protein